MTAAAPTLTTLSSLQIGDGARVVSTDVDAKDAALLRAMGLVPGATIRVSRTGNPCIVTVLCTRGECHCNATRIGLAADLAQRIVIEPAAV